MTGLHEAFDELVAEVPVYGDLERAIEQADRDRRRRNGWFAGLAAAAAVVVVVVGVLAITRDANDSRRPDGPPPPADNTTTETTRSQSRRTWIDTPVAATRRDADWHVPDPLKVARDAWFAVVAEHLDPQGGHLTAHESSAWGGWYEWPAQGSDFEADTAAESAYDTFIRVGLVPDNDDLNLLDDGCAYLRARHPEEQGSCSTEPLAGRGGARARVSRWERRCGPPATCGDYVVAVAVDRRDGLIGFVQVDGRGTADFNPFTLDAMVATAADPGLSLPEKAFTLPSDPVVRSVVEDHLPGYENGDESNVAPHDPGYAQASGTLGRRRINVQVWPAGAAPTCGRRYLVECVERRVYGADDRTTVFVGTWDEENWATCCPKNSRADRRQFVYVGPRHTVVVSEFLIVRADEDPIGADLDQRLIDVVLDPRLQ
jgi:hypothetical protein